MSVDYEVVGGIGVTITDEIVDKMIVFGAFDRQDWIDDKDTCLDEIGITYVTAGNAYIGDETYYWMIEADTLFDVNHEAPKFIAALTKVGIDINKDALEVISDLLIY